MNQYFAWIESKADVLNRIRGVGNDAAELRIIVLEIVPDLFPECVLILDLHAFRSVLDALL